MTRTRDTDRQELHRHLVSAHFCFHTKPLQEDKDSCFHAKSLKKIKDERT